MRNIINYIMNVIDEYYEMREYVLSKLSETDIIH